MLWFSQNTKTLSWNSSHFCFEIRNPYLLRSFPFGAFLIFLFMYVFTCLLLFCLFFVVFFPWWWVPPTIHKRFLQVEEQKEAFDVLDSDGNGKITFQEVKAGDATGWWLRKSPYTENTGCFFFKGRGKSLTHPPPVAPKTCRCCKKYRKICLGWIFFYGFSMGCQDGLDWLRDPQGTPI